jgi:hypothetical protein
MMVLIYIFIFCVLLSYLDPKRDKGKGGKG